MNYLDGKEIVLRPAVEAIRLRPHMYVGEGGADVHHLVLEAMCLALTEGHCGSCTSLSVHVDGVNLQVSDNGLGISLEPDKAGVPFAQRAMTVAGACRDHKEHQRLKHQLCAVGLVVVNALSSTASVVSSDGQRAWRQSYTHGVPEGPFTEVEGVMPAGTTLQFQFEADFLGSSEFDPATLRARVDALETDLTDLDLRISSTTS